MENTAVKSAENGVEPSSSCSVVTVDSLFPRKIQFQLSTKHYDGYRNSGDFPIETLNPDPSRKRVSLGSELTRKADKSDFVENMIDPEFTLGITFKRIGAGLENMGNTCFLNSVLQCLTYTEPLAAYLQSGKHQNSCHIVGFCALCAIQKHVSRALQSTGRSLVPKDLVSNLRCISRNFRNAGQEDAHEYMVNLLESMHKCCLPSGVPSNSTAAYEKSLVHKIFGGRFRNQVECQQCHYCSNKFDPFLDLSISIFRADSLNVALRNFTAAEMIGGGGKDYPCERCKQKVKAKTRLTVHKAPYVLWIHLKRFDPHNHGRKDDKKVTFEQTLDMKPFVSGSNEQELKYSLYCVVVHYGHNTRSGHYVCYVRTSSCMWYLLNDNQVHQVSEKHVLEQKAYMLFYVRDRKNTALRRTVDLSQKESINETVSSGNIANVAAKQLSNGCQDNGSIVNRLSISCSSATVNDKDAASTGCIKETRLLQNDELLMAECSVPRLEPTLDASSNVPFLKEPLKVQTLPSQDLGEGLSHSALHLSSKHDGPKLKNTSNMKGARTSDSGEQCAVRSDTQNSVVPVTNMTENVDPVRMGPPTDVLCEDFSGRAAGKVQSHDFSVVSGDKVLGPGAHVNSQSTTGCNSCQVVGRRNEIVSENLPCNEIDDGDQNIVQDFTHSSTSSLLPNDCQQKASGHKPHKKRKYKLLKSWLFRASLGVLRKKMKYRKCKHLGLESHNLIKQQLLEDYCLSTDSVPSTSEKPLRTSPSNLQSKDTKSSPRNGESRKRSSKDTLMVDVVDVEFKGQSNKNVSMLAMNEEIKKIFVCRAEEKEPAEIGTTSISTRCLEESTVARWDGVESLPSHSSGLHYEENLTIGYVPDEWDEEYDRGKRKKVRQDKENFGGPNPFQEIATRKSQFKKAKMDRSSSGNRPFRI